MNVQSNQTKLEPENIERRIQFNKAGYTAGQSRTVGQEQKCKTHLQFRNVMDGLTDGPTDRPTRQGVESRVRD